MIYFFTVATYILNNLQLFIMEKVIYIAGGCFWGVEAYYQLLNGVVSTRVGYANGDKENPTYEEVKQHLTTHVETLKLTYDDSIISLETILEHFLRFVNPYTIDKQGEDEGHQYRSGVYYENYEDEKVILDYFDKHLDDGYKIEVKKLENFYDAEDYHQDYLTKNPGGYCHINLRLVKKNEKKVDKKKQWLDIIPPAATLLTMILLTGILSILKNNPVIAEAWTRGFGQFYFSVVAPMVSWFPLSITEIYYITIGIIIIVSIVQLIRRFVKKKPVEGVKKIFKILNIVAATILTYTITCEFAYKRNPVDLPFYQEKVDNSEFKDIYNYFAEDLNYCISQLEFGEDGDLIMNKSIHDISLKVEEAYKIIESDYFYKTTVHAKPMMSSFIYRELQITGITFAPFGEPNVNYLATSLEIPVTIAHEIAHTKGVMREDEANQVAFYVCLNSDDIYLRFSAYAIYFYQMGILTSTSYMTKEDKANLIAVNSNYTKARLYASKYWKDHDLMTKIGDWFNNLYIKSSGDENGTAAYSGGTQSESGEPTQEDPTLLTLVPSKYQKLFFEKYYRNKTSRWRPYHFLFFRFTFRGGFR